MGCFKTWCLSNFPFMEDDIKALDNYRLMCKLYEYIKNIASDVSNLTTEYNTLINDFKKLKEYVDTYLEDLDDVKKSINIINNKIDSISNEINLLNNRLDNGDITIYDPTTGIYSNIQTVINNLYSLSNTDGLTANEFDLLDLTVTTFESYEITANQFDTKGKLILV